MCWHGLQNSGGSPCESYMLSHTLSHFPDYHPQVPFLFIDHKLLALCWKKSPLILRNIQQSKTYKSKLQWCFRWTDLATASLSFQYLLYILLTVGSFNRWTFEGMWNRRIPPTRPYLWWRVPLAADCCCSIQREKSQQKTRERGTLSVTFAGRGYSLTAGRQQLAENAVFHSFILK